MDKKKHKKNNTGRFSKKGFTLVEMLVSIFIFTSIVTLLAGTFGGYLKNYKTARENQSSFEDAQFALGVIAKTLESSSIDTSAANQIQAYDSAAKICYRYYLPGPGQKLQAGTSAGIADISSCNFAGIATKDMANTPINSMYVAQVKSPAPGGNNGKATIVLNVQKNNSLANYPIQTTVSLRDVPQ